MSSQSPVDILKEALLLERRGRAFYQKVADQTGNAAIKDVFETMAAEEERHMQILSEQLSVYSKDQNFAPLNPEDAAAAPLPDLILSDEVKNAIASSDFESAAVSAAMLMEERAVAIYSQRAQAATDADEKRLFRWLAQWEQGHLKFLADLDRDIKARIWNDNQFWPF
jgi:rubrerythrin